MKLCKEFIAYILLALSFYALPKLITDTGSGMLLLLILLPLLCLAVSAFYGFEVGFRLRYPLIVCAMFVPAIFLYYNASAWVYCILYGLIALIGSLIASLLRKK